MPWPEFSELSFGFSFLREFERHYANGGHFPAAPSFITGAQEAKKGYDVKVLLNARPVFFQFKRSYVLTTRGAKEIQSGDFHSPKVFRMKLYKKHGFRQHTALQLLERQHPDVFYVTSKVEFQSELNKAYFSSKVIDDATAIFSPLNIQLPNYWEKHHVSFKANSSFGYVYSEVGNKFLRKHSSARNAFNNRLELKSTSPESETEEYLLKLEQTMIEILNKVGLPRYADVNGEHVAERVAIMAFWGFDAHLKFFNANYKS